MVSEITLDQISVGAAAAIVDIDGERHFARRLMEMGLVAGTPLEVVRWAPFGDPIEIQVRGYSLTLRRSEARSIRVRAR